MLMRIHMCFLFFFNDTATTEIYTLSLHDALPIFIELIERLVRLQNRGQRGVRIAEKNLGREQLDRKSTRLNSSHSQISYAVFCLKKKKKQIHNYLITPARTTQ